MRTEGYFTRKGRLGRFFLGVGVALTSPIWAVFLFVRGTYRTMAALGDSVLKAWRAK